MHWIRCTSLALLMLAAMARCVQAQCSGWLPGNCRFESGTGYMMCNSDYCTQFGLPAQTNSCESAALCDRMCQAAADAGGTCTDDYIPWQLDGCGSVSVIRRQITIPDMGPVNCDAALGCQTGTCSLEDTCPMC